VSPGGNFLVIRSTTDGEGKLNTGLYVTPIDGSSVRRLKAKPQATDPAWSPDGERIAYFSNNLGGDGGFIVTIPAAPDGEPTPITAQKGNLDADPTWSPDSNSIVFRRAEGGDLRNKEIWIMNTDGSNQRPLTDLNSAQDPTFSPRLPGNTSQLVFTAPRPDGTDRELYLMKDPNRPDEVRQLTNNGGNDTHPRWSSG
jgi:Tol biopolymer transport system component